MKRLFFLSLFLCFIINTHIFSNTDMDKKLITAVKNGNLKEVTQLINKGANYKIKIDGSNAIEWAMIYKKDEIFEYLLSLDENFSSKYIKELNLKKEKEISENKKLEDFKKNNISPKEKIVIFDIKTAGIDSQLKFLVLESLTTSIIEANRYEVLERDRLDSILKELKLVSSDDFTDKQVIEIGQLAKATIAIVCSLTRINNNYTLNSRIINIESGSSLFAKNITVFGKYELMSAIKDMGNYISVNKKTSNLYIGKISTAVPLCVVGLTVTAGSIIGLGFVANSFVTEENEYINNPYYDSDQYLQIRNAQIGGIVGVTLLMTLGVSLFSVSLPFFIQGYKYKREFSFSMNGDMESVKVGMGLRF